MDRYSLSRAMPLRKRLKNNKSILFLEILDRQGGRVPEGRHKPSPNDRWTEGRAEI